MVMEAVIENALCGKTVSKIGTDSTDDGIVQIFIEFNDGTVLQLEAYTVNDEAIIDYTISKD